LSRRLQIGLLLNPVAGLGGAVALKGSDGATLQLQARQRGAVASAATRCIAFLDFLSADAAALVDQICWHTPAAPMGAQCFADYPWRVQPLELSLTDTTTAADTRAAAKQLQDAGVDLIVFVGGDGTARDLLATVGTSLPVLGIPAGVKMHSGVFAVSPRAGAQLVSALVRGGLVAPVLREVRDFDPGQAATDAMTVSTFGEMWVPEVGGYLQQTKIGGKESEPLAVQEICARVLEILPGNRDLVIVPGSTCLAIKQALGMQGTLRGCDVIRADGSQQLDATARELEALSAPYLIVSFTRGQGFLFGRGNQQISAVFLKSLAWPQDVCVVGTRTKLNSLEQRPLLVDTGDVVLDDLLSGLVHICAGYEDSLLYRVST
jgi:predicted polyphosphate/ATP-dependent NAD kinase